jgi:hypothetical protein
MSRKSKPNSNVEVDTEFVSEPNKPTLPLTTQIRNPHTGETDIYDHPNSPVTNRRHKVFDVPFLPLAYYTWREVPKDAKSSNSFHIDMEIFFSFKDIQFSCFNNELWEFILEELEKTRRIRLKKNTIRLPYEIKDPIDNRWKRVSLRISDLSAMLGNQGLKSYANITGVKMDSKDNFTKKEKSDMYRMYIERPEDFDDYAKGDCVLHEIRLGAKNLFDYICDVLEIEHAEEYGMSTGTIVARIISRAIAKKMGFKSKTVKTRKGDVEITPVESFAQVCAGSHPNNIQSILSITNPKDKSIPYAVMVDGGRAINATLERVIWGVLCDLDIGGCYANGLKNQKFPIGSPTKIIEKQTLRQFLKKYEKQFIEGLWQARISTLDKYKYSFEQDLFVSKVDKSFTLWENGHGYDSDGFLQVFNPENLERVYDASMVLPTREVNQTILNHDLLQVIRNYWSKKELGEFLDNTIVESALVYEAKNYRPNIDVNKMKGMKVSNRNGVEIEGSKLFTIFDLSDIITPLIAERKKVQNDPTKGKKSPQDLILKLILNTVYGCVASQFFTNASDGISNVVVGNNITARVRVLAWCMEKALRTHMSITDGGVLDVNKVLVYKKMSSQIFHDVFYGKSVDNYNRVLNFTFEPLLGKEVTLEELKELVESKTIDLDKICWNHCSKTFPKLDIFSANDGKGQFSFEYKSLHWRLIKHNKVDYLLDDNKPALRGAPRVEKIDLNGNVVLDKFGNPVMDIISEGYQMFEDILNGVPSLYEVENSKMLSLADYWIDVNRKDGERKYAGLYPHDTITEIKKYYSITPLGCRFEDLKEYNKMKKEYEEARKASVDSALKVADIAYKYGYPV